MDFTVKYVGTVKINQRKFAIQVKKQQEQLKEINDRCIALGYDNWEGMFFNDYEGWLEIRTEVHNGLI